MSNDKTEVLPTTTTTAAAAPTRRSILRAAPVTGAPKPERSPFADWRDQTPTEELPAVSPDTGRPARAERAPSRRTPARHLRCALAGALLAIVAISGISAYAAHGIADGRQAALDHARSQVSVPR